MLMIIRALYGGQETKINQNKCLSRRVGAHDKLAPACRS